MSIRSLRRRSSRRPVGVAAVALTAMLAPLGAGLPAASAAGGLAVTVVDSATTVRPGSAVAGSGRIALTAARNEFESAQVVLDPGTAIADLTVTTTALEGTTGSIPAGQVTIYREQWHTVTSETRTDGESAVGLWPDALVPQRDYIYGEKRAAFSRPIAAGERTVLWIDLLVPAGQAPGAYAGSLTVRDGANALATVPFEVDVRDITLPSTATLSSLFLQGSQGNEHCAAMGYGPYCSFDVGLSTRLRALFARVALENRTTISNPWPVAKHQTLTNNSFGDPSTVTEFRNRLVPLLNGTPTPADQGSQIRLAGARATSLALLGPNVHADESIDQACNAACVTSWKSEAARDGFADRLLYYVCDEPFLNSGDWGQCMDTHTQVSGPSGLPELVTGSIDSARRQDLGNGADAWLDILAPVLRQMAGRPEATTWRGDQSGAYDGWIGDAADGRANELWLYSSCESGGCNGPSHGYTNPAWNAEQWNGWAGYAVDAPAAEARAMSWLAFEYGATGELYFDVDQRLKQAWGTCADGRNQESASGCLYAFGMHGDGTLFYPGRACAPSAADLACIGGTHDIPLESLRLKRIRDGREDYELLHQLAQQGAEGRRTAEAAALSVFGPTLDEAAWSTEAAPSSFDRVRRELFDAMAPAAPADPPTPEAPTVSVLDAEVLEGTEGVDGDGAFTPVSVRLTRTGDLGAASTLRVTWADGTARENQDYAGLQGGASFAAGQAETTVPFDVRADDLDEADETFTVRIAAAGNARVGDGVGVVTIRDDDETTSPPDSVSSYGVDASLGAANGSWIGEGVVAPTVQTRRVRTARGRTVEVPWRTLATGDAIDSYSLVGNPDGRGVRVRFFRGTSEVTGAVRRGEYSTGSLPPGGSHQLRVLVTAGRRAAHGTVRTIRLDSVSYRARAEQTKDVRDVLTIRVRVP